MTSYSCPTCGQMWSMNPTRDHREGKCAHCLQAELDAQTERLESFRWAVRQEEQKVEQTLGQVLGYPWFKDDQTAFPGSTAAEGVCVGEHVPATLAREAADYIRCLKDTIERQDREASEVALYYQTRLELIQEQAKRSYPFAIRREILDICALGTLPN